MQKLPSTHAELQKLADLRQADLDELPFGAIKLDREGKILSYNATESRMTGRDPEKVVGRNFFTEVAPCTNVKDFAGRFRQGVDEGELHAVFPYRFDFEMEPTDVWVSLFYSKNTETAWVFVSEKKEKSEAER